MPSGSSAASVILVLHVFFISRDEFILPFLHKLFNYFKNILFNKSKELYNQSYVILFLTSVILFALIFF